MLTCERARLGRNAVPTKPIKRSVVSLLVSINEVLRLGLWRIRSKQGRMLVSAGSRVKLGGYGHSWDNGNASRNAPP